MNGIELIDGPHDLLNGLMLLIPLALGGALIATALLTNRIAILWAGVAIAAAVVLLAGAQSHATGARVVAKQHAQVASAYGLTAGETDVIFGRVGDSCFLFSCTSEPATLLARIDGKDAKLTLRRAGNYVAVLKDGNLITPAELRAAMR